MTTPKRPNLLALVAAIEGNPSTTPRAHETPATDTCERCGKRVPAGQLFHDDETEEAVCGSCPVTESLADQLHHAEATIVRLRADRDALLTDKAEWKAAHASVAKQVDALANERNALVDRIATLTRELAEARNDRAAEDRTATRVATDASAWHFHGRQGEGTADRIKAVGGIWRFHARTVRDQFHAAGYWLVPTSDAARELYRSLIDAGHNVRVSSL